jgi:hypothetical protein
LAGVGSIAADEPTSVKLQSNLFWYKHLGKKLGQ